MPVTARSLNNLQVEILADHEFHLHADEPVHNGGDNTGPDPYGLLLSSLAACKVMTVQMYARRKQWPLEEVKVQLDYQRIKAKDCEDCTSPPNANVDIITVNIGFTGPLDDDQIARLTEISERCPVHRTLLSETKIRTTAVSPNTLHMA